MTLDDDKRGEGEPIPDDGPEWHSVAEECAYWKALALSYGAKLRALESTLQCTWTVRADESGTLWAVAVDHPTIAHQIDPLSDIAKNL